MKKTEYFSIFMTTLMIVIPVGAVIILIVYAFGLMAIPEGKTTYDFIKDHGSLFAGLIGFIGVFILIWYQNKTTRDMINSNTIIMKSEALEAQKVQATEYAASIGYKFNQLRGCLPTEFQNWVNDPDLGKDFFKEIKLSSYLLDAFIQNNSDSLELVICKECVDEFIDLYEQPGFVGSLNAPYQPHQFNSLLASLMNLYSLDGTAQQKKQSVVYTHWLTGNVLIHSPHDLYSKFSSFKIIDISGFIIQQMDAVVMPALIYEINMLEVSSS